MLTIYVLCFLFLLCITPMYLFRRSYYTTINDLTSVISGTLFATLILSCLLIYIRTKIDIESFNATKETIQVMRTNTSLPTNLETTTDDLEIVALQHSIIKNNSWLAKVKYLNSYCDICVPDEVLELKPLK